MLRDALRRALQVRALEFRARHFADPADRLHFLRGKVARISDGAGGRREATQFRQACLRHIRRGCVTAVTLLVAFENTETTLVVPRKPKAKQPTGQIRLVQTTPQFDLYSNGLRVEEQYATSTAPRRYLIFPAHHAGPIGLGAQWRSEPAGIVYHTTESHMAPFEESENRSLRRAGEGLLAYVSRRRSYHFIIDRFGRVFRIVRESDYANHSGNSVWADRYWVYINLNQSFLGIAFEAHSRPSSAEPSVNAAQIYAGRILTDMLRSFYGIPASNCVAHAQVSVNPSNYGVGYHMDWAAHLPFSQLGLPNNYTLALPSVTLFGFAADPAQIEINAGGAPQGMSQGWEASVAEVRREAAARDIPLEDYRKQLQKRYRDAIQALRGNGAYQEYN